MKLSLERGGCNGAGVPGEVNKSQRLLVQAPDTGWRTVAPNIQHTPAGGYRVRQRVGKRRITLGVFTSLAEALSYQAASVQAVEKRAGKGRPTLGSWMATYLERRKDADVRSVASEGYRAKKHILTSKLARIPLENLRRADVLAWLRELDAKHVDEEGQRVGWSRKKASTPGGERRHSPRRPARATKPPKLSYQTKKHCLKLLRGALEAALDEQLIEENPALGVKLRKEARTDDGSTVLSPAEQTRLADAIPEPERSLILVALGTGLRMGEQWALELVDLHLDVEVPYIDVRYGAPGRKPTKAGRPRMVPLVGPALDAMRSWTANLTTWCSRPGPRVFPSKRGDHRGQKPPRGWKDWLRKSGITRRVRWHDLRHTCASALVSGQWGRRWSLEEVKELLGHASITTTERYAKFAKNALIEAAAETNAARPMTPAATRVRRTSARVADHRH